MPTSAPPPITIAIPVTWGDMDAFGHVNNIFYFRYFETARIEYLRRIGWMTDAFPISGIGVILHSVQCRFRIPVTYPDTLDVSARLVTIEQDRITLAHEVRSRAHDGAVAAEGSGLIVAFDYSLKAKSAIPEAVRRRILELESGSGPNPPS